MFIIKKPCHSEPDLSGEESIKHSIAASKLFTYATKSAIFNISIAVFFSLPIWLLLSNAFNSTRAGTAHCLFFTTTCECEEHADIAIDTINSIITFIFTNNLIYTHLII